MKQKISVSIDEKKIVEMNKLLEKSRFRSRSHVVEYALEKLLEGEDSNGP
ncbi:MAG: ribbon-helix-helix domain-containing protein [Nanoarchaeota archaeon]|nr:ribbon-helix-helix domain-containing protein [Nanoarchaeota archaeon]